MSSEAGNLYSIKLLVANRNAKVDGENASLAHVSGTQLFKYLNYRESCAFLVEMSEKCIK